MYAPPESVLKQRRRLLPSLTIQVMSGRAFAKTPTEMIAPCLYTSVLELILARPSKTELSLAVGPHCSR